MTTVQDRRQSESTEGKSVAAIAHVQPSNKANKATISCNSLLQASGLLATISPETCPLMNGTDQLEDQKFTLGDWFDEKMMQLSVLAWVLKTETDAVPL